MAINPFIKAILENPGITPTGISNLLDVHVVTARKQLKKILNKYPVVYEIKENENNPIEIFVLKRSRGYAEAYGYEYKKTKSISIKFQQKK